MALAELALIVAAAASAPPPRAAAQDGLAAREQLRLCAELPREAGVEPCRRAIALGLSPLRAAIAHRLLAEKLAGLGRWEEVTTAYRDLVALTPGDPDARHRLGSALLHGAGRPQEAEAELRASLALAREPRVLADLGCALNALGQHAEAVQAIEQALGLSPELLEARPALGAVLAAARRGEPWPPAETPVRAPDPADPRR